MIVTRSCFKGLIDIPNLNDVAPNSNMLGNDTVLTTFIDEYERDYLVKALGYSIFKLLKEELPINDNSDQKWKDLVNGKEYTKEGVLLYWKGLLFTENQTQISPIAFYIWYHFLENGLSNYTGTGLKSEKTKNASKANPAYKAVKAWNKFFDMTVCSETQEVALYQFIEDMNSVDENTYPNWSGFEFGGRNIMSL